MNFLFNGEDKPAAITGVTGAVSDLILPCVGDTVRHCDDHGAVFFGKVTDRLYSYTVTDGTDVDGTVTVTVSMDPVSMQ